MRLHSLRPDLAPLRASRDLRLVVLGTFVSGLGSQATLVALPCQVYTQTHSALLVGLLGSVELVPLVAPALLRYDADEWMAESSASRSSDASRATASAPVSSCGPY